MTSSMVWLVLLHETKSLWVRLTDTPFACLLVRVLLFAPFLQVFEEGTADIEQPAPFFELQKHGPAPRYIAPCTIEGEGSKEYNAVPCEWRGGRE